MMTLSLCMIVKNESDVLARCLDCVKDIADEMVVVDTGSTDGTKEIAGRYTSCVYDFPWRDDFAAARNFSFSKATMDYTMWLDADDVLALEDQRELLRLKAELDPAVDMVFLPYDVAFDGHGNPTLSYFRERIVRTSLHCQWVGEIHEVIPRQGVVEHGAVHVRHQKLHPTETGRNLRIFERMLADGKTLDPRQQYYYGRELMYNGRHAAAADQLERFLREGNGWVENNIAACKDLAQCRYALGEAGAALESLLRSLVYDAPRAELCCDIGGHFMEREQYRTTVFWYETALTRPMDEKNGGFCLPDCYGYIPCMQLCVCYDRLGERERAIAYNDRAGRIKPEDNSYQYNLRYFQSLGEQTD